MRGVALFLLLVLPFLNLPAAYASLPSGCSGSTDQYGYYPSGSCSFQNTYNIQTSYKSTDALGGQLSSPSSVAANPLPLIQTVLNLNQQSSTAQWLITCPQKPNPSSTLEYFVSTTNPASYIEGDSCLVNADHLTTTVQTQLSVGWSSSTPASAQTVFSLFNPASVSVGDKSYSGATDTNGNGVYNISNGYDSTSYIFGQVPASKQYGIWTWNAKYVNLGPCTPGSQAYDKQCANTLSNNAQLTGLEVDQSPAAGSPANFQYPPTCTASGATPTCSGGGAATCSDGIGTISCSGSPPAAACTSGSPACTGTVAWDCQYPYSYGVNFAFGQLANTQIPIPQPPPSTTYNPDNYFDVNGQAYSPTYQDHSLSLGCAGALWNNFLYGVCGAGWTYISGGDTLVLPPGTGTCSGPSDCVYNNVNAYVDPNIPNSCYTVYAVSEFLYIVTGYSAAYVTPCPGSLSNKLQYISGGVSALPYFLYNLSMPASISNINTKEQFLNLSFDIYSPHNYMYPATSLEPFPLYTDSGFFASYHDTGSGSYRLGEFPPAIMSLTNPLSGGLPSPTLQFLASFTAQAAQTLGIDNLLKGPLQTLGDYVLTGFVSPNYIAASPSDFVYILNTTTQGTNCIIWCFGSQTDMYLTIMRFIPQGYYNLSNYQPGGVGPVTCDGNTGSCSYQLTVGGQTTTYQCGSGDAATCWQNLWEGQADNGYWANSIIQQANSIYATSIYHVNDEGSPLWSGPWTATGGSSRFSSGTFNPMAIASDYGGDLFMLGQYQSGSKCDGFQLAELAAIGANYINSCVQKPSKYAPGTSSEYYPEFAASPGGQYLYLADTYGSGGSIYVYQTPPSGSFSYVGYIPLSYSNSAYNFNIIQYLADGGPYGNTLIANQYTNVVTSADSAGNHYPVGVVDYKGLLYVLDDWSFTVCTSQTPCSKGSRQYAHSDILMLRAFTENGVEVPIDGSQVNPFVPISGSAQQSLATGGSGIAPSGGWAPYGWPLAASIGLPDGSTVTYCALGCTETPKTMLPSDTGTGYLPIGPFAAVASSQPPNQFGFSMDFNGTAYIIAHAYGAGKATELLEFRPQIVNYTATSYAAESPYVCYTDQNFGSASPCIYDSSGTLSNIYAPVLGVPSAFSFVESQGAPQQYLSFTNILGALFPTASTGGGGSGSQSAAQQTSVGGVICTNGGTASCSTGSESPVCVTGGTAPECASVACFNSGGQDTTATLSCAGTAPACSSAGGTPTCYSGATAACTDSSGTISCSTSSPPSPVCTAGNPTCPAAPTCGAGAAPSPTCSDSSALTCTPGSDTAKCTVDLGSTVTCATVNGGSGTPECAPASTPTSTFTGTPSSATGSIPSEYANSVISGYLLVPYQYSYSMTQTWNFQSGAPINIKVTPTQYTSSKSSLATCGAYPYSGPSSVPPATKCSATGSSTYTCISKPTVYTSATSQAQSNYLQDTVQGGSEYLQYPPYNQNFYVANLSDAGLIIAPNLNFNIYGERWIGAAFINSTITPPVLPYTPTPTLTPSALTVNAVQYASYQEEFATQNAGGSTYPGYYTQDVVTPPQPPGYVTYGANYCKTGIGTCPFPYYYEAGYTSPWQGTSTLSYLHTVQTSFLQLSGLYVKADYLDNLWLDLGQSTGILGYNRLVYTFADAFNNIITMPLDVNFANVVSISTKLQTLTDPSNPNQTTVTVTGTALSLGPDGTYSPLPAGSQIYLYYDSNLNYYNTNIYQTDPSTGQANAQYYQYALQCAFGVTTRACQIANPLSSITQPQGTAGPQTSGPSESQVQNFATQNDYSVLTCSDGSTPVCERSGGVQTTGIASCGINPAPASQIPCAVSSSGTTCPICSDGATPTCSNGQAASCQAPSAVQCAQPQRSLLQLPNYNECNIYGYYGLSSMRQAPGTGSGTGNPPLNEYCLPAYLNGNGVYTSQLGLFGTATTDATGSFSNTITACGSGSASVIAQYYGYPGPEPLPVSQPSLQYSAETFRSSSASSVPSGVYAVANEYNYYYSPVTATSSISLGSYQLGFGTVGVVYFAAFAVALVLLMARAMLPGRRRITNVKPGRSA